MSVELVPAGEFPLPDTAPQGLSGITWLGANLYALAEDSGGRIHKAEIEIDRVTGEIGGCEFLSVTNCPLLRDAEGIAFDAMSGALYASDESGPRIVRIANGEEPKTMQVPATLSSARPNKSLESLSLGTDGNGVMRLWTANEEALTVDGEMSTPEFGSVVRIFAIDPDDGSYVEWRYRLQPARGRGMVGVPYKLPFTGLVDVASLGDGLLLVLERSCGFVDGDEGEDSGLITSSIFMVDTAHTAPGEEPPKKLLWRKVFSCSNYEGMALGPELTDGFRSLVLVADGDANTVNTPLGMMTFQWTKALFALKVRLNRL